MNRGCKAWNLEPEQWSDVLLDGASPEAVAEKLMGNAFVPWSRTLVGLAEEASSVLDLGSGRGEHSAVLAMNGKETTLLEWSEENIDYSRRLYDALGVSGCFVQADMTEPLPFDDRSFDMVFSCGVFEYFDEGQIDSVLQEAFRVCRSRVVLLVPNGLCIPYRIGKWHMERTGSWCWGGEQAFLSLKPYFRRVGCEMIREFSAGAKHSLNFLTMSKGPGVARMVTSLLRLKDHPDASLLRQGYLLICTGDRRAARTEGAGCREDERPADVTVHGGALLPSVRKVVP